MSLIRPRIQTWDQPRQIVGGPQADGLIGAWPLAEGGGTTIYDLTGQHNGYITNDLPWVTGPYGAVPSFNNTLARYADIAAFPALNFTSGAYYIRFKAPPGGAAREIVRRDTPGQRQFLLEIGSGGLLQFLGIWGSFPSVTTAIRVDDNAWHSAVATMAFNGTNSTLGLYLDGVLIGNVTNSGPMPAVTSPLNIGHYNTNVQIFNGNLSDLRAYGRVPSLSEIQSLYTDPLALVRPTLRRTWNVASGPIYTRPRVMLIA